MTEEVLELAITALAAGGDGVGRDASGRVTFVARTAPGDRVRVRVVTAKKSFARAELVAIVEPSPDRVTPGCRHFVEGCGGCAWQHVVRPAQLAAKQAIVVGALRGLAGLAIEPIADPCPPLGWRRRARFHVAGGRVGLYAHGSHRLVAIASCPQLEPALDAALQAAAPGRPDGELAIVRGHAGDIAVGDDAAVEVEPGLWGGAWDFAQASSAGNAALVQITRAALGHGRGALVELHAGAGNLTRALVADGWDVTACDVAAPARPVMHERARFVAAPAARLLAELRGPIDALVLDPPRSGAADAIDGIARAAPTTIVYVSCDPATLARDAARLVAAGYRADRAWPIDLMPQTAHVEVVLRLRREPAR